MSQRNVCYSRFCTHDTEPKSIARHGPPSSQTDTSLRVGTKRASVARKYGSNPAAEKDVVRDVTEKRLLHRFYFLHRDTEPNGFSTPCLRFMFFS